MRRPSLYRCIYPMLLAVAGTAHAGSYYPSSCLSFPLVNVPVGPTVTAEVPLLGNILGENVTLHLELWRQPCDAETSAIMVNATMDAQFDTPFGMFSFSSEPPRVFVRSNGTGATPINVGGIDIFTTGGSLISSDQFRLVTEPNTRASKAGRATFGAVPHTYVLEIDTTDLVDPQGEFEILFSYEFFLNDFPLPNLPGLPFPSSQTGSTTTTINTAELEFAVVPAYDPMDFPEIPNAIEISGRVSGSFFAQRAPGEGVFVEVGERRDGTRFVFMSWFTYDNAGNQRWLFGNADLDTRVESVTIPLQAAIGGAFPFQVPAALLPWGSVELRFPNCDTLLLDYASAHNQAGLPSGSGAVELQRLSSVEFAECGFTAR